MRRILKELIIAIPFAIIAFIAIYLLAANSSGMQIKGVVVEGDKLAALDTTIVNTLSEGYDNIYVADLNAIGRSACDVVKSHSVSLRRRLDMKIGMTIESERPVMWVNSGRLLALSSSGRILSPSDVDQTMDLPVLVGLRDITLEEGKFCRDLQILYAIGFLNEFEHRRDSFIKMISTVRVDSVYGIIITIAPREISVTLGFSDFAMRISKLKSVVEYLNRLEQLPELVDVRSSDVVQVMYPDSAKVALERSGVKVEAE